MPSLRPSAAALALLLVFAGLLSGLAPLSAQDQGDEPNVTARLANRRVYVGETTRLIVELRNVQGISMAPEIDAPGLQIRFLGNQIQFESVNGQQSRSVLRLEYLVETASTTGRFAIPPMEFVSSGKTYATEPLELLVAEPDPAWLPAHFDEPYFLHLALPKSQLYVGEIVPVRVTLYVENRNSIQGMNPPQLESDDFALQRFNFSGTRGVYLTDDSRTYSTMWVESTLFPVKDGRLTVGPAAVEGSFVNPTQADERYRGLYRFQRMQLESNTIDLEVLPLPKKDKPASFTGAVGQFRMEVNASPLKLTAGDPISLDVTIFGNGNFQSIDFPTMTESEDWKLYPTRETGKTLSDGTTEGRATYSRVIVPLAEHDAIPSLEFAFFDPEAKEYVTLVSKPLGIEVAADPLLDPANPLATGAGTAAADASPALTAASPEEKFEDILDITHESPVFRKKSAPLMDSPLFWALQAGPALLIAALIGRFLLHRWRAGAASRKAVVRERTAAEIRAALKREELPRPDFYRDVLEFLTRWNEEHGEPSPMPVPEERLSELQRIAHEAVYGAEEQTRPLASPERQSTLGLLQQFPA